MLSLFLFKTQMTKVKYRTDNKNQTTKAFFLSKTFAFQRILFFFHLKIYWSVSLFKKLTRYWT